MPLRNQPYLPLYVQDYLTDEKLNSCSASSQGVYIKIMCILHKQDEYGTLNLFKQKDKQNTNKVLNFACKFAKLLPFDQETILKALEELIDEGVLIIENDKIFQKRMVKDGAISDARSKAGKSGGGNPNLFKQKPKQKVKQSPKQNTEDDIDIVNENKIELIFPFTSENFLKVWGYWKQYKNKEHGFKFKTVLSEQAALKKLGELAKQDEDIAIKIIEQSLANGWQGFFELKDTKNGNKQGIDTTIMQEHINKRERERETAAANS
jgi:hypothetical protein